MTLNVCSISFTVKTEWECCIIRVEWKQCKSSVIIFCRLHIDNYLCTRTFQYNQEHRAVSLRQLSFFSPRNTLDATAVCATAILTVRRSVIFVIVSKRGSTCFWIRGCTRTMLHYKGIWLLQNRDNFTCNLTNNSGSSCSVSLSLYHKCLSTAWKSRELSS